MDDFYKKILDSAEPYDKDGFHYKGAYMLENTKKKETAAAINCSLMFILDNLPNMNEEAFSVIEPAVLAIGEKIVRQEEAESKKILGCRLASREEIRKYLRDNFQSVKQQNAPAEQAHQLGQKEPQDYPQQFLPLREVFETKDVKSGIYCTDSRKDNT